MTRYGTEEQRAPAIVVDEARVPATGWLTIALDPGSAPAGMPPLRVTDLSPLTGAASGRVPDHAFVQVGSRASRPAGPRTANDNARPDGDRSKRSVWRDLFFLTLLAATIMGAFWSGRLNAGQRVIVVPGPSSYRSVVT